jgi:hypothetical protein
MSHSPGDNACAAYTIRNPPNALQDDSEVTEDIKYVVTLGSQVLEEQWRICSMTFSEHYGVWSATAPLALGFWAEAGQSWLLVDDDGLKLTEIGRNIAMSSRKLRRECAPEGAKNTLITAVTGQDSPHISGNQVGHCLVSDWEHEGHRVWWITQLVVRREHRGQKKATRVSNFPFTMASNSS